MAVDRCELHGTHEAITFLLDSHLSCVILDFKYGAEVGDVYFALVDHEVVGLDVPVHTLQSVDLYYAVKHLHSHISNSIVILLPCLMFLLYIVTK